MTVCLDTTVQIADRLQRPKCRIAKMRLLLSEVFICFLLGGVDKLVRGELSKYRPDT